MNQSPEKVQEGSNTVDKRRIEDLIARVAMGNRQAFSNLYDATSAKLFGICLRVLKDRDSAEDVVQDTFVKVWRNAGQYRANGLSPMTWLITIARNTAIDRLRAKRHNHDNLEDAPEISDPAAGPEQQSVARSEQARIERCLETLQTERADAVRGAYLNGETYADLAERFQVPINTMRTWLRRSLMALRECMEL